MKTLRHEWTDEESGRQFSVCEGDNLTPCQREILNLRRQLNESKAGAQKLLHSWISAEESLIYEVSTSIAGDLIELYERAKELAATLGVPLPEYFERKLQDKREQEA